jgi:hypothetical protein
MMYGKRFGCKRWWPEGRLYPDGYLDRLGGDKEIQHRRPVRGIKRWLWHKSVLLYVDCQNIQCKQNRLKENDLLWGKIKMEGYGQKASWIRTPSERHVSEKHCVHIGTLEPICLYSAQIYGAAENYYYYYYYYISINFISVITCLLNCDSHIL